MIRAELAVAAIALVATVAVASAQAQTQIASPDPTIWDHNGSVMYLVAKGQSREFYYATAALAREKTARRNLCSGYSLGSFARFFNSANARPARRPSLVAVESSSLAWSVRPASNAVNQRRNRAS
jgi:hypothetical protein